MDEIDPRLVRLVDIALVRLVASRYRELQGLRTIVDGGALIVMGAGLYAPSMYPRTATGPYLALFVFALCGYGWFWWKWTRPKGVVDAFYSNQCGRVAAKPVWPIFITTWIALEFGPILFDKHVGRWASVPGSRYCLPRDRRGTSFETGHTAPCGCFPQQRVCSRLFHLPVSSITHKQLVGEANSVSCSARRCSSQAGSITDSF